MNAQLSHFVWLKSKTPSPSLCDCQDPVTLNVLVSSCGPMMPLQTNYSATIDHIPCLSLYLRAGQKYCPTDDPSRGQRLQVQHFSTHLPAWDVPWVQLNNSVGDNKAEVLKDTASCLLMTSGLESTCVSGLFFLRSLVSPANKQTCLLIVCLHLAGM